MQLIDKASKNSSIYFEINDKLSDFNNDNLNQFNELMKVTLEEKQALTDNKNDIQQDVMDESAKKSNFFHDYNKPNNPE